MALNDENDGFYLFVDSVTNDYDGPSTRPAKQESSADSPFIGKTPRECYELLKEFQSVSKLELDLGFFAILEERSSLDESVLLVDNCNCEFATVQMEFSHAITMLMCYMTGHMSIEEDAEMAQQTEDKIFRAP